MDLKTIQKELKAHGFYAGPLNGEFSADTKAAMDAVIASVRVNGRKWGQERKTIAAGQALAIKLGIDAGSVDGFMGPQTRHAIEVYEAREKSPEIVGTHAETWRDADEDKPPLVKPPKAASEWPKQSGVLKFYGPVGQNQTTLKFPYPVRLAWNKRQIVKQTSCHEKIHDAADRVYKRVLSHYGEAEIKRLGLDLFGGCLNVRKMRGGSSWSMHSWGIAFDWDPERNQLKWGADRAVFAQPAYLQWWKLWEEEGFLSLGRARNYDWMHVQAARL